MSEGIEFDVSHFFFIRLSRHFTKWPWWLRILFILVFTLRPIPKMKLIQSGNHQQSFYWMKGLKYNNSLLIYSIHSKSATLCYIKFIQLPNWLSHSQSSIVLSFHWGPKYEHDLLSNPRPRGRYVRDERLHTMEFWKK